jgi:hypothetical protein
LIDRLIEPSGPVVRRDAARSGAALQRNRRQQKRKGVHPSAILGWRETILRIDSTGPGIPQQPMGENLWITGRRPVCGARTINGPAAGRTGSVHADAADAGAGNGFIHNFSAVSQGTLCPTKLFGIIKLFERRPGQSPAACPLYDRC